MDKGVLLRWYKRKDVQEAIVDHVEDREVATRFDAYFGKRPDIVSYPRDILEAAMRGATSFHASEERWDNPLLLSSSSSKKDLDGNRIAWDLILDIDCPHWELSKTITAMLIRALQEHNVKTISVKFSGNKGFHIAVPFEAFPKQVNGTALNQLFPDAPRRIAQYLIYYLGKYIAIKGSGVDFGGLLHLDQATLKTITKDPITTNRCLACNEVVKEKEEVVYEIICRKCHKTTDSPEKAISCPQCNSLNVEVMEKSSDTCPHIETKTEFHPAALIDLDTILISSRHLYRIPYSLHEKSGLASVPIALDQVMAFEREMATPDGLEIPSLVFADRNAQEGEARQLLLTALDFTVEKEEKEFKPKTFELPAEAIPIDCFPPCIKHMLAGIEDGRKRALFVLVNFLKSAGWEHAEMEAYLKEWNERNPTPLKEGYLMGQIRYAKHKDPTPPPNFSRKEYYDDIGCNQHDNLCKKVKNPLQYAKWRWRMKRKDEKRNEGKKNDKNTPAKDGSASDNTDSESSTSPDPAKPL